MKGGMAMTDEEMRAAIMNTIKANGLAVTGDFWLMLVFRTSEQLRKICRELKIKVDAIQ